MHFPDKSIIKKIIIILLVIFVIIISANSSILYFNNQFQKQLDTKISTDFLNYIDSGNLDDSLELWQHVYNSKKDDSAFLEDFSTSLQTIYSKYYNQAYIEKSESDNLHEICRIFYDFLTEERFNNVVTSIYDDFYNGIIEYSEFISILNDFNALSQLKSSYIQILHDEASYINESRVTYFKAINTADAKDYTSAIELLRTVSTKDTIYYPKAIEKIDEYILKLKELVKTGN